MDTKIRSVVRNYISNNVHSRNKDRVSKLLDNIFKFVDDVNGLRVPDGFDSYSIVDKTGFQMPVERFCAMTMSVYIAALVRPRSIRLELGHIPPYTDLTTRVSDDVNLNIGCSIAEIVADLDELRNKFVNGLSSATKPLGEVWVDLSLTQALSSTDRGTVLSGSPLFIAEPKGVPYLVDHIAPLLSNRQNYMTDDEYATRFTLYVSSLK